MKVTILTGCHNCGKYISTCIQSVLNQTYSNWEMIIHDDLSKDNSVDIINKFVKKDKRIKLIRGKKQIFCGAVYNSLVQNATGDICGIIDGDDAILPHAMKELVSIYEKTQADYIWTQFWICDKDKLKKQKIGFSCAPPEGQSLLDVKQSFSHWRTFKTYLRDKTMIFSPEYKRAVDKWMGYALEEVGRGVFYNKPLYLYRNRMCGTSDFARKQWKNIRRKFSAKRQEKNIIPLPITTYA